MIEMIEMFSMTEMLVFNSYIQQMIIYEFQSN